MIRLCLIFLLFTMGVSLFNMTAFSNMPNKTYSNGLGFSSMQSNSNQVFLSVKTTSTAASIVRWNVTSSLNVTLMGSYKETNSQSNIYYYTFFMNGYIVGCLPLDNTPCRVFNQSTYAYLGPLSINLSFGRGEYLQTKNIFVFGATTGQFGYFTVANLPNVTPTYVYNLSSVDFVFLQKSHDQTFISVSYKTGRMVTIWRVSDWALLKNITVGAAGVYTQAWSADNQYLMVFLFNQTYVEVYNQYSNWTLSSNVSIGYKNIRTNFYYNQTNVIVALSENSKSVILINWYDFSVTSILTINGWKMYRSDNQKALTIFQPNSGVNTAWFFNINPYCQGNTVFNIPQKKCVTKCSVGCQICLLNSCTICSTSYVLSNGACYTCGPATVYNSMTLSCDSCSSNCNTCMSSSNCTLCKSGYNIINSACGTCPAGTAYNSTSKTCYANCTSNCQTCATSTTCSTCKTNYNLLSNGTCITCPTKTYFNSTLLTCVSCSTNCDVCTSNTACTTCTSGTYLVNNACITCPAGQFYSYTSSSCQANCIDNCASCTNSTNCATCQTGYQLQNNTCTACSTGTFYNTSTSTCQTCSANCTSCSSNTICTVCQSGYQLLNDACVVCSSETYYNSSTLTCEACSSNCTSCSSSTICSVCQTGYQLQNGACVACSSGQFYNTSTSTCQSCSTNCTSCSSSTNCQVCQSDYQLLSNACVACSSGTFYDSLTSTCESCSVNCTSCSSSTNCSVCGNGSNLSNFECISCPIGNVYDSGSESCVINCTSNCVQCATVSACAQCVVNFDLFMNGSCLQCSINQSFDHLLKDCISTTTNNTSNSTTNNTSNTNNTNTNNNTTNNDTNTNNTIIITPPDNTNNSTTNNQSSPKSSKYNTLYQWTMGMTVQNDFIAMMNQVPGSRRIIKQIFAFFLNIDHLWLYIYHKRQYGYYVNRLFIAVQNLQQQKWNLVSDKFFNQTLHIDMSQYAHQLNYKINQTSYKYIQIENQSTSFFENSLDYFFLNLPLVLTIFFLFKFMFYLFFKYQISLLFREYAFNGYLLLMLIQGNCESFSYLFIYDSLNLNGTNFKQKLFNILTLVFFVFFIMQLVAGFFLIKSSYDKHAKYFYDNCGNTLKGSVCLLIENGFLNFFLGAAHIVLQNYYNYQLLTLFFIELSFISIIVYQIKHSKIYQYKYIQWMNVLASFLRILLIFTYYFDQKAPGQYEVVDQVQMYLIIIYLFNWIFSALIAYSLLLYSLFAYLRKKIFLNNSEKEKFSQILETSRHISKYKNLSLTKFNPKSIIIEAINQTAKIYKIQNKNIKISTQDENQKQNQNEDSPVKQVRFSGLKNKPQNNVNFSFSETKKNLFSRNKTMKKIDHSNNDNDQIMKNEDEMIKDSNLGAKSHKKLVLKFKKDQQEQQIQQWKGSRDQMKIKTYKTNTPVKEQESQLSVSNFLKSQKVQTRRRSKTDNKLQKLFEQSLLKKNSDEERKDNHKSIKLRTHKRQLKNLNSLEVSISGITY